MLTLADFVRVSSNWIGVFYACLSTDLFCDYQTLLQEIEADQNKQEKRLLRYGYADALCRFGVHPVGAEKIYQVEQEHEEKRRMGVETWQRACQCVPSLWHH